MTGTINPLRTSEVIREAYLRYLRSLLPVRDAALAAALDEAITSSAALTKGPLLEVTPPYATGSTLEQLADEGVLDTGFGQLASAALPFDRPLYRHQEQAVRKVAAGRNVVVATGTGSGKTESFLLPILNELSRQHAAGELGPGVRALLLYPMNALANDQVKRLRQVLAHAPHITFGRYTGDTPDGRRRAVEAFEVENPGQQRLPNELLSREEMRATPPHLLLTNYAMLEYMLLRPLDVDLFQGEHAGTWRFIVVDEAHVYDGAKGAELAMLLRRLVDRVSSGTSLQCIATSATVGGNDLPSEVTDFAQALFSVRFEYTDDPSRQDLVRATRVNDPVGNAWGPLAAEQYSALRGAPEELVAAAERHGCTATEPRSALLLEGRVRQLLQLLSAGPRPMLELAGLLFAGEPDALTRMMELVELAAATHDAAGAVAVSARYHLFARATEGAFTCLSDKGPHVSLARHEQCEHCSAATFEFGACKRCGTVHLAGRVDRVGAHSVFRARRRLSESPTWLVLSSGAGPGDEDEEVLDEQRSQDVDQVSLCAQCGALYTDVRSRCSNAGCTSDQLRQVLRAPGSVRDLGRCVTCGGRGDSLVRLFESGNDAAVAVLATALYQEIPPVEQGEMAALPGQGRKLLLFSDSRQAAAYFAPYFEDSYQSVQRRRLVLQGLSAGDADHEGMRSDDLVEDVVKAAQCAHVFGPRDTRRAKARQAALWVHQELLSLDERQSLEGLGLVQIRLERDETWVAPAPLRALGLGEQESWDLVEELVRTLRTQGAVTTPEEVDPSDEAFDPRRGPIWVRENTSESRRKVLSWLPTRGSNRRVDYLTRVLAALGQANDRDTVIKLLSGIWKLLSAGVAQSWLRAENQPGLGAVRRLDHDWLHWRLTTPQDMMQRCDRCRRISAFSIRGVCSTGGCEGSMQGWVIPEVDDTDHYRILYRTMLPVPLRVQEHTAQWTNKEASRIQRQFVAGELNALSCSTTFELGVDVGELQSVVLRNMPPTTANYIQRAGRAGRRADSAALVLTYAQRRSHDLSRFAEPERMIAGDVRAPFIPLGNARIDRRHAHSVVLAAFFRHHHREYGSVWREAGEFFTAGVDGWVPADLVDPYLQPVPADVRASLEAVLPRKVQSDIGLTTGDWVVELTKLLVDVRDELQQDLGHYEQRLREAVEARKFALAERFQRAANTIKKRDLLGLLASRNILPKYGFPVDSVELRTTMADVDLGNKLELSRDLSAAIYEYAPGAEIVAGGFLWQSGGVYRLPDRELLGKHYAVCSGCGLYRESEEALEPSCPACSVQVTGARREYVIPSFGFVATKGARRRPGQQRPRRAWNGETYVLETGLRTNSKELRLRGGVLSASSSERGELVVLSDGRNGSGFLICDWCGWGTSFSRDWPRSHDRLVGRQGECTGPLSLRTLAHKYQTDVLELRLDSATAARASETGLLSTLYAILEGGSQLLEVSRDDVDGALHRAGPSLISMVLFDVVPGGAGHVGRFANELERVLPEALRKVQDCECGSETSCYRCLRVFRNERFHDDLSRGAARDVLAGLLGESPSTIDLPSYPMADVPTVGRPGEQLRIVEEPNEIFERARPGQLDLHVGRVCLAELPEGRFVGTYYLQEGSSYSFTAVSNRRLQGAIDSLSVIAASK